MSSSNPSVVAGACRACAKAGQRFCIGRACLRAGSWCQACMKLLDKCRTNDSYARAQVGARSARCPHGSRAPVIQHLVGCNRWRCLQAVRRPQVSTVALPATYLAMLLYSAITLPWRRSTCGRLRVVREPWRDACCKSRLLRWGRSPARRLMPHVAGATAKAPRSSKSQ